MRNGNERWLAESDVTPGAAVVGLAGGARDGGADHAAPGRGGRPAEDGSKDGAVPANSEEQSEVLDLPSLRRAGFLQACRGQDQSRGLVRAVRPETEVG